MRLIGMFVITATWLVAAILPVYGGQVLLNESVGKGEVKDFDISWPSGSGWSLVITGSFQAIYINNRDVSPTATLIDFPALSHLSEFTLSSSYNTFYNLNQFSLQLDYGSDGDSYSLYSEDYTDTSHVVFQLVVNPESGAIQSTCFKEKTSGNMPSFYLTDLGSTVRIGDPSNQITSMQIEISVQAN